MLQAYTQKASLIGVRKHPADEQRLTADQWRLMWAEQMLEADESAGDEAPDWINSSWQRASSTNTLLLHPLTAHWLPNTRYEASNKHSIYLVRNWKNTRAL